MRSVCHQRGVASLNIQPENTLHYFIYIFTIYKQKGQKATYIAVWLGTNTLQWLHTNAHSKIEQNMNKYALVLKNTTKYNIPELVSTTS